MSGQWPPEWEDQEEESSAAADQLDTEAEARLSEVAAYLASVPVPVLPDAVETRISAALAAEAARFPCARARAGAGPGQTGTAAEGTAPAAGHRRDFLRRPVVAVGSLVVCLLLAGLGFTLARRQHARRRSQARPPRRTAGIEFRRGIKLGWVARRGDRAPRRPRRSLRPRYAGAASSFLVTASGTRYQRASLSDAGACQADRQRRSRVSRGLDPRGGRQFHVHWRRADRGAARVRAPLDRRRATPAGRPGHLPG